MTISKWSDEMNTRDKIKLNEMARFAADTDDANLALKLARLMTDYDVDVVANPWNQLGHVEPRLTALLETIKAERHECGSEREVEELIANLGRRLAPLVGPDAECADPFVRQGVSFDAALWTLYRVATGLDDTQVCVCSESLRDAIEAATTGVAATGSSER
jgi:hypothetical protein